MPRCDLYIRLSGSVRSGASVYEIPRSLLDNLVSSKHPGIFCVSSYAWREDSQGICKQSEEEPLTIPSWRWKPNIRRDWNSTLHFPILI